MGEKNYWILQQFSLFIFLQFIQDIPDKSIKSIFLLSLIKLAGEHFVWLNTISLFFQLEGIIFKSQTFITNPKVPCSFCLWKGVWQYKAVFSENSAFRQCKRKYVLSICGRKKLCICVVSHLWVEICH